VHIPAAQASQAYMTTLIPALIPLVIIGVVFFALAKWAAPAWALILALLLGVVLSGTIAGPEISLFLSQLSGGRLH
jgi:mannose/fructose/N-acetylgalactosamine-specific phosphotransferase system component IID